jgi:hypothetical protein
MGDVNLYQMGPEEKMYRGRLWWESLPRETRTCPECGATSTQVIVAEYTGRGDGTRESGSPSVEPTRPDGETND